MREIKFRAWHKQHKDLLTLDNGGEVELEFNPHGLAELRKQFDAGKFDWKVFDARCRFEEKQTKAKIKDQFIDELIGEAISIYNDADMVVVKAVPISILQSKKSKGA